MFAGIIDGVAVQVAGGGGGGGRGVGNGIGRCFGDVDIGEWDGKSLSSDHGHLCVEALTHLAAAMGD